MSTFEFQTHISANGEVAPIPGWTGGEADVRIIVVTPKTEATQTEKQRKEAGRRFFDTWNGLLEGMPDLSMEEIRAERLKKKYGS